MSAAPDEGPRGFADSFRSEMPRLVLFVMHLGADLSEARDIAQDAFVSALPRWPSIEHPAAYLRTTASREYIRRSSSAAREQPTAEVPDVIANPDALVAKVEFRDQEIRVLVAIRRLPPRQRQVFAWTLDGFTPTEIAHILNVSAGAVRASLLKARRELQRSLLIGQGGEGCE
jgi:RNA polymerase sigma factor (sigma-70 family)